MFQIGAYETAIARTRRTAEKAEWMSLHGEAARARRERLRGTQAVEGCRAGCVPVACCAA